MGCELAMHWGLRGVCGLTNFSRMACFPVLGIVLYIFILIRNEIKSMFTSCVCLQPLLYPFRDCSLLLSPSSNKLDYLPLGYLRRYLKNKIKNPKNPQNSQTTTNQTTNNRPTTTNPLTKSGRQNNGPSRMSTS